MAYNPDCKTDSRVYVNGTRLPVADVDLYLRKEGQLDVTRYLEAEFASPFRGEHYADAFQGINPEEQTDFDTVRVDVRDTQTEQYTTAFRGVVTGVGNSSEPPEQIWRFRAQGPSHFLSKVPASKRFTEATAQEVLEYVAEELDQKLPFPVTVADPGDVQVQDPQSVPIEAPSNQDRDWPEDYPRAVVLTQRTVTAFSDRLSTPHTFQANKDTLADVVSWLQSKTDVVVWLSPTENGVGFVVSEQPTLRSHRAHYLGGDTAVINNDALTELTPINTLTVKGSAKKSLFSIKDFQINEPTDTFTTAKVRHQPLYERAGETELHAGPEELTDAHTKEEVINEAKALIRKTLNKTTEGSMQTLLRGPIRPFDTITAKPTCDEEITPVDVSITYEVDRVHHKIRASEMSETDLNVGVHAHLDDIKVIDSWNKEV